MEVKRDRDIARRRRGLGPGNDDGHLFVDCVNWRRRGCVFCFLDFAYICCFTYAPVNDNDFIALRNIYYRSNDLIGDMARTYCY